MKVPIATLFIGKSTFRSTELSSTVHPVPDSNNTIFLTPVVSFRHFAGLPLGTCQNTSPTTTTPYAHVLVASWTLCGSAKPPLKVSTTHSPLLLQKQASKISFSPPLFQETFSVNLWYGVIQHLLPSNQASVFYSRERQCKNPGCHLAKTQWRWNFWLILRFSTKSPTPDLTHHSYGNPLLIMTRGGLHQIASFRRRVIRSKSISLIAKYLVSTNVPRR